MISQFAVMLREATKTSWHDCPVFISETQKAEAAARMKDAILSQIDEHGSVSVRMIVDATGYFRQTILSNIKSMEKAGRVYRVEINGLIHWKIP